MARTSFIEHQGVRIASLDFAKVQSPEKALTAMEVAGRIVQAEPFWSGRTLAGVTGSRISSEVLEAVKRLAVNNGHAVLQAEHPGLCQPRRRQDWLAAEF